MISSIWLKTCVKRLVSRVGRFSITTTAGSSRRTCSNAERSVWFGQKCQQGEP